jgi:transcriptional regulator with XRE-family HTH domain
MRSERAARRGQGRRGEATEQRRSGASSDVGVVLSAFMREQGLTQVQLADKLGLDRTYVSKILSGNRQLRDIGHLRHVARTIAIPPERFGLLPDTEESVFTLGQDRILAAEMRDDVGAWRKVRMVLNHRRSQLTKAAASLHGGVERIVGTPLITAPGWMPAEPVELGTLKLAWADDSLAPAVRGGRRRVRVVGR